MVETAPVKGDHQPAKRMIERERERERERETCIMRENEKLSPPRSLG